MLDKEISEALSRQVNEELFSAYLYLALVDYFAGQGLPGCAQWMRMQHQEEMGHAWRIIDYVHERGGRVRLHTIKEPKGSWASPLEAFESSYKHECHISSCIHDLYALAQKKGDYPTQMFLQWFVQEQVEEEASVAQVVQMFTRAGKDPAALLWLDAELGKRKSE